MCDDASFTARTALDDGRRMPSKSTGFFYANTYIPARPRFRSICFTSSRVVKKPCNFNLIYVIMSTTAFLPTDATSRKTINPSYESCSCASFRRDVRRDAMRCNAMRRDGTERDSLLRVGGAVPCRMDICRERKKTRIPSARCFFRWCFFFGLRLREPDVVEVSELLVDHDAEDSHHGPPAVVQFDGSLGLLPLVGLLVPTEIDEPVSVVTGKLGGSGLVVHDDGEEPDGRQRQRKGPAGLPRDAVQLGQGLEAEGHVLHAGETDPRGGHQPPGDGQHAYPAVAELDLPQPLEVLGVTVPGQPDGIPVPVGSGGAEVVGERGVLHPPDPQGRRGGCGTGATAAIVDPPGGGRGRLRRREGRRETEGRDEKPQQEEGGGCGVGVVGGFHDDDDDDDDRKRC
mmetsp:Transcript_10009/g.24325  ORF Transcript_10009/g.24325 Transcript_10009/m.24325 type:complete len:400 (-) Transcript_10009:168-1367(-)